MIIITMNCAVLTISYREGDIIESVIKNWQGLVRRHLILESKTPWHGKELPQDSTREICEKYSHVEYVSLDWKSEAIQRNWGLGRLVDYDYVIIVDADELYTKEDQTKILDEIGLVRDFQDNQNCYRASNVKTYFKTPDHALSPRDSHEPAIALNPRAVTFSEVRIPSTTYQIPINVTCHHISYLRSDQRLKDKLTQFEHFNIVKPNWYEDVWLKWTPSTPDVRAYGRENSKAIYDPMPEELRNLLNS